MTPFLQAVARNDIDAVRTYLALGCTLDDRDADHRTGLILSTLQGHQGIVAALLSAGADINAKDNLGNTALHYAAQDYLLGIAELMVHYSGVDIDAVDMHGNTPLWRAVYHSRGRGELIALLLNAGANPDHRNKHGKSPRDAAGIISNYDVKSFFES